MIYQNCIRRPTNRPLPRDMETTVGLLVYRGKLQLQLLDASSLNHYATAANPHLTVVEQHQRSFELSNGACAVTMPNEREVSPFFANRHVDRGGQLFDNIGHSQCLRASEGYHGEPASTVSTNYQGYASAVYY
ncbi:hypothetical protein PAXRUDRAFT_741885 [Paxillus rubicundulus Ve08.2h10]|uniref:Uncharacterized protein n=1 Tax=Paxillus rubicundulus Ve08.2h10 TaxID=930991 RepID=A0A0D0E7V1_9AGAM|nr:hypothetical protein PAXRUDRAFT_741885 [Paxillus rubicundulus Ve08.2h10]